MKTASLAPYVTGDGAVNLADVWASVRARRVAISAGIAFIVTMVIYLLTIMPGLAFFDTAEYQTAPYVLGNLHPTGYPLYAVVGKIFGTLVPIGDFAYRMNLMSSLCAALMAALLIPLALRYDVSPVVALAAALAFALGQNTWRTAKHADPHPLTALIAASIWLMAVKWRDSGDRRWLWAMALASGLGMGGAAIVVAEMPAIIIYATIARPRRFFRPVTMIVAAVLGVAGLVGIYSYLPIRAMMRPPLNYGDPETWPRIRSIVLSGQGFLAAPFRSFVGSVPDILSWYAEWFTPAGRLVVAVFALAGFIALLRKDWRLACAMLIGVWLPMCAAVSVPNMERGRYFILCNWLIFFAVAAGVQATLMGPIARLKYGSFRQSLWPVAAATSLFFPYYLAQNLWNTYDMHNDRSAYVFINGVFSVVKPNAVVLSWWGASTALWYGHYVEGFRPDVEVIDDSQAEPNGWQDLTSAIDLYYGKRPVYAVAFPDELVRYGRKYQFRRVAKLDWFGMAVDEVVGRKPSPLPAAR